MGSRSSWPCLLLALTSAPLAAQVSSRTLANPQEFAESFDRVTTFRELSNGKLLLVDMGPKTVQLVDFASGQLTTIGRNGQGPGEYQFPSELIPYLGDTTLVVDRMSRRALPVTLDGKMGKTISYPEGLGGMADPRAADAKGRLYFQASAFNFGGRMEISAEVPESTTIVRWDRTSNKIDTVARVKVPSTKINLGGSSTSRTVRIQQQPYAGQDEWAVTREGRVGVIRMGDYHFDWLGESPARGAPVKYDAVKVGAEEREAFMAQSRDTRNRVVMTSGGPGRGPENKPPEANEKDFEWPAVKPPFVPRSLLLAPEGEVWVQRSAAASDSVPVYDVFDAKGNLASRVTLPKGRRMVGLGKKSAYAVRTDDDGLQWLERYQR